MNSIINAMPKYDHRQHVLSDWLAELDQRFQLGEEGEDTNKITWCQLLIGATGSGILSSLDGKETWEDAKEALLTRLDIGSVRDEAWAALKNLKKGSKDIVELTSEAEKLAKRLHPRDKEASECHAVDAFLGALDRTLAAEVQKLGHKTMEDIIAAAHRIEKILEEQSDTKMERLVSTMQDQIRLLKKDLKEANEQIAVHRTAPCLWLPWPLFPPQPQQPLQPLNRLLPPPLATSTRITARNLHSIALPADRWIIDPRVASSAEKKATLCLTALPDRSSNAFSESKHSPVPAARHEDKSWSCRLKRTTPTQTPTYS